MKNNLIIVGDLHVKYIAPSFRKESFYAELLNKIRQIKFLAEKYDADVICLGDFFNSYVEDYFELISFDLCDLINGWYSVIGNHDCKSANGDLRGTSFGSLVKSNILKVLETNDKIDVFHYYNRKDFGKFDTKNKIAFIHDYIMPAETKENFEFIACEQNNYNFVFCGHYHYPFDKKAGNTRYINPGSVMRLTISEVKLNRNPEVILFNTEDNSLKHIKLKINSLEQILQEQQKIDINFNSKFADMLLENNLLNNSGNDIVELLNKNNVDDNIVNYVKNVIDKIK